MVSYDISNDRLRSKLAQKLISHGMHRIQYSVFLGNVGRRKISILWKDLGKLASLDSWSVGDSLFLIPLHKGDIENIKVFGSWPDRWSEMTGAAHTLII